MNPEQTELQKKMQERFLQLPKVVQDAILSADVEKHLRSLSDTHKLHIDQWEKLENEVTLTLLGFESLDNLAKNIQSSVGLSAEQSLVFARAINESVFEPIRKELERGLEHPEATEKPKTEAEALREQLLHANKQAPTPATPPAPLPEQKIVRGPASGAYKPGEPSSARKVVADDPYREPPK